VPDASELERQEAGRAVVAMAQPALAGEVLSRWLQDYEKGAASPLVPSLWSNPPGLGDAAARRLGVVLRTEGEPGVVIVTDVSAQSAAFGLLQVGDRVLGVDGRLLSLEDPGAKLHELLMQSKSEVGPTLRVQRGQEMREVVVPRIRGDDGGLAARVDPIEAMRELASIGKAVRLGMFSVHAAGPTRYSARLSLRFVATDEP
jgi:hypothetical protein